MRILQMNIKKHLVYGSIMFIWIVVPTLEITFTGLIHDIKDGRCIKYPTYMSYASKKARCVFSGFVKVFKVPTRLAISVYQDSC